MSTIYSKCYYDLNGKPLQVEYKTVDTSTIEGEKQAEKLHTTGWKINRSGLFTIQFYRLKSNDGKILPSDIKLKPYPFKNDL